MKILKYAHLLLTVSLITFCGLLHFRLEETHLKLEENRKLDNMRFTAIQLASNPVWHYSGLIDGGVSRHEVQPLPLSQGLREDFDGNMPINLMKGFPGARWYRDWRRNDKISFALCPWPVEKTPEDPLGFLTATNLSSRERHLAK